MQRLRWRVPILSVRDEAVVTAFTIVWAAAVANFTWWWFRSDHVVSTPRLVATTVVLGLTVMMPLWLFTAARRMRRPGEVGLDPTWRVAMIVTKSPGEPWSVVRGTLTGMLGQVCELDFDVWLADEDPAPETLAWCDAHGVKVSCRADAPEYHRMSWPRRARCKEGNLAYFYDRWGYDDYDIVAQLDADHVPEPSYLVEVLRGFADPSVGYVAAPSICDSNAHGSWAARGRLHRESTLHGVVQAGHNDGLAPTCIGSHYAVRTAALRDCGGLGPELAEDFSTSFIMNVRGWRGAFAIDAIAHGEGPETFADAMVQELQWSRSLQLLQLRYCRHLWSDLPTPARWKLRLALWWYPMFAMQMTVGFAMPLVAILTRTPWVEVNLAEFFPRVGLVTLTTLAFVGWLRAKGTLRPADAPLVSWEGVLFQLARWPWVTVGLVQATWSWISQRETSFKVTPKGQLGNRDLPLLGVAPHLALSALATAVLLLQPDPGAARGYQVLAVIAAATYATVSWAVVVLHARENPSLKRRALVPHAALATSVTLFLALTVALRGDMLFDTKGGALRAVDLRGVASQPTTWVWGLALLAVPVFIRRLRHPDADSAVVLAPAVDLRVADVADPGLRPVELEQSALHVLALLPAHNDAPLALVAALADDQCGVGADELLRNLIEQGYLVLVLTDDREPSVRLTARGRHAQYALGGVRASR